MAKVKEMAEQVSADAKHSVGIFKTLKHPTFVDCIKYGVIILLVSAVIAAIISCFDLGITELVSLVVNLFS